MRVDEANVMVKYRASLFLEPTIERWIVSLS